MAACRSNPGTPTQPRRPDFIGVVGGSNSAAAAAAYYDYQSHVVNGRAMNSAVSAATQGSPQRRFLSEGELLRDSSATNADIPPPYPRSTNNTVDNIRELAGSPQRGAYTWKDNSPNSFYQQRSSMAAAAAASAAATYDHYRSNPTSPTQRTYYPALRGGVPVYPPQSPQVSRDVNSCENSSAANFFLGWARGAFRNKNAIVRTTFVHRHWDKINSLRYMNDFRNQNKTT